MFRRVSQWFRDLRLVRKVTVVIAAACGGALLLAFVGFLTYEMVRFRAHALRTATNLADVIAANCTAVLRYNDAAAGQETLRALGDDTRILALRLFRADGTQLAEYLRGASAESGGAGEHGNGSPKFEGNTLTVYRAVGTTPGSGRLSLQVDLRELRAQLRQYLLVITLVLGGAAIGALGLSFLLQRTISQPILTLVAVARSAAEGKDYGVRAPQGRSDELGQLSRGFNAMLDEIQHREAKLREVQEQLHTRDHTDQSQSMAADRARHEQELQLAASTAAAAQRTHHESLARVGDEILRPMQEVRQLTERLLESPLTTEQRAWVEAIRGQGQGLELRLANVAEWSRLEAGTPGVARASFNLPELVSSVCGAFLVSARQKGLQLESQVDPDVAHWLEGDPGRCRQVLSNLVSNAVKFADQGQVAVRVSWDAKPAPGATAASIRFTVQDTGPGIPPPMQDLLLHPAATGPNSADQARLDAPGFGLRLCRRILDRLQGRLGAESTPGRGSTVWFSVPVRLAPAPRAVPNDTEIAAAVAAQAARAVTGRPVEPAKPAQSKAASGPQLNRRARLDPSVWKELHRLEQEGEREFVHGLIDLFKTQTPQTIAALRAACTFREGELLAREAGRLKGAAMVLGAGALAELCERVEELAGTGGFDDANSLIVRLDDEYEAVLLALEHEVGVLAHPAAVATGMSA